MIKIRCDKWTIWNVEHFDSLAIKTFNNIWLYCYTILQSLLAESKFNIYTPQTAEFVIASIDIIWQLGILNWYYRLQSIYFWTLWKYSALFSCIILYRRRLGLNSLSRIITHNFVYYIYPTEPCTRQELMRKPHQNVSALFFCLCNLFRRQISLWAFLMTVAVIQQGPFAMYPSSFFNVSALEKDRINVRSPPK